MWQELYKTVFRYLLKLGLPRQDAEDMAQEALLSTCLPLDGIRPGKLHAYLLATARHKCIDFLRKNNREFAVGGERTGGGFFLLKKTGSERILERISGNIYRRTGRR